MNEMFRLYSIALSGIVGVAIAGWLGSLLDKALAFQFPIFVLLGIVLALIGAVMGLLKELDRRKKK